MARRATCLTPIEVLPLLFLLTSSGIRRFDCVVSPPLSNKSATIYAANKWSLVTQFAIDGSIDVELYKSALTGLHLAHSRQAMSVVAARYYLITEARNDEGAAHTLEHMIFHGSKDYPFANSVGDLLKQTASGGINAFTSADHTGYIHNTAGVHGFIEAMLIYLRHILWPVLDEKNFINEVHHINGKGEDGGVVFSEMQYRESAYKDVWYAAQELTYIRSDGEVSSYAVRAGGSVEALRENTSLSGIIDFHEKFYRPDNLMIAIVGNISVDEIFEEDGGSSLDSGRSCAFKNERPFERPFQTEHVSQCHPRYATKLTLQRSVDGETTESVLSERTSVEALTGSTEEAEAESYDDDDDSGKHRITTQDMRYIAKLAEVQYADSENDSGIIMAVWPVTGSIACPNASGRRRTLKWLASIYPQLSILLSSLSVHTESPLSKAFVTGADPIASSISFGVSLRTESILTFTAHSVPLNRMHDVIPRFYEVIDQSRTDVQLDLIHLLITQEREQFLKTIEEKNGVSMFSAAATHFIYGDRVRQQQILDNDGDEATLFELLIRGGDNETTNALLAMQEKDWVKHLDLFDATLPNVVKAYPNITLDSIRKAEEEKRLEEQKRQLGPDGIAAAKLKLEAAKDRPAVPDAELEKVAAEANQDDLSKIMLDVPLTTSQWEAVEASHDQAAAAPVWTTGSEYIKKMPFAFHATNLNEATTVRILVAFNIDNLTQTEKLMLPILLSVLPQANARSLINASHILTNEDMAKMRLNNTLDMYLAFGLDGSSFRPSSPSNYITAEMTFTEAKFTPALATLQTVLFRSIMTNARIRSASWRIGKNIKKQRLALGSMLSLTTGSLLFNRTSPRFTSSVLRQEAMINEITADIDADNTTTKYTDLLHAILPKVFKSNGSVVALAANFSSLETRHPTIWAELSNLFNVNIYKAENDTMQQQPPLTAQKVTEGDLMRRPTFSKTSDEIHHNHFGLQYVVEVQGSRSCHLKMYARHDMTDPATEEVAAAKVLFDYLRSELHQRIRDSGSAYGASLSFSTSSGLIAFFSNAVSDVPTVVELLRQVIDEHTTTSPNIAEVGKRESRVNNIAMAELDSRLNNATKALPTSTLIPTLQPQPKIQSLIARTTVNKTTADHAWRQTKINASKQKITFGLVTSQHAVSGQWALSLSYLFGNHEHLDYTKRMSQMIKEVTTGDMKRVADRYLRRLLDPTQTMLVLSCGKQVLNKTVSDVQKASPRYNFRIFDPDSDEWTSPTSTYSSLSPVSLTSSSTATALST